jgi:hypothetical protein
MKPATKRLVFALILATSGPVVAAAGLLPAEISGGDLTVRVSDAARIVEMTIGKQRLSRAVSAETRLAGCRQEGAVAVRKLDGGGMEFTRSLVSENPPRKCTLVERFTPTRDSIRWEIEICGPGEPWTTAISTQLRYPHPESCSFWTVWSDPEHRSDGWRDPLVFRPLTTANWSYANVTMDSPMRGDYIAIPIVTLAEPAADAALSLVLSPEDTLLDMSLATTAGGSITFERTRHRLGGNKPVRFAADLVAHAADWRAGLGWMVHRYPQYFNPINPKADEMAGCGAYSGDENPVDVAKLKRMAFRTNWKLSDDFPYMGMFLPPLENPDDRWDRSCDEACPPNKPRWTTFRRMNDYAHYMRQQGFYVLDYFNVTEFGKNMKDVPVAAERANDPDLWKHPIEFLKLRLPNAYFRPPMRTCYEAWGTDIGDPDYRRFMLEQAKRHIERIPDSAGICIDRMDWLRYYNLNADDGVSWVDGKPARSLHRSWLDFTALLGPLMHGAGKVIFVNNHSSKQLPLLRDVDGVYCEFCQAGPALNATGLLCVRRPALGWTSGEKDLRPNPDAFFQRHLHMGVFPTAPYPGNNHCITPSPWVDKQYLAYGPLLDAMRGRKWVLRAHAVEVVGHKAKANFFEVPGGYVVPVTFGGQESKACVVLHGLPRLAEQKAFRSEVLHPGETGWTPLAATKRGDDLVLDVPLVRGCAMVRLACDPIEPK